MIELTRNLQAAIKHGGTSKKEIEEYVISFPMSEIVSTCAELLMRNSIDRIPKIVLSEEEFNAHFRIMGYQEDNRTKQRRGRPKKEQDDDAKLI